MITVRRQYSSTLRVPALGHRFSLELLTAEASAFTHGSPECPRHHSPCVTATVEPLTSGTLPTPTAQTCATALPAQAAIPLLTWELPEDHLHHSLIAQRYVATFGAEQSPKHSTDTASRGEIPLVCQARTAVTFETEDRVFRFTGSPDQLGFLEDVEIPVAPRLTPFLAGGSLALHLVTPLRRWATMLTHPEAPTQLAVFPARRGSEGDTPEDGTWRLAPLLCA